MFILAQINANLSRLVKCLITTSSREFINQITKQKQSNISNSKIKKSKNNSRIFGLSSNY